MIALTFQTPDGKKTSAEAQPGETLLRVGQRAGQPLEGTCGGQMACATCHVLIDPNYLGHLPTPSAEEEDMLDLVPDATRSSRLACQIVMTERLADMVVRLP
ncbi:2Fe-2S iron-sulfur cluster binding domain-containing protein [Sphingomonas sanguinis]|uniref:2Fe-2S iron-sulfur cluster-binding protein n=1 Tax=Sphingomonas sanguinis TaxID=33051 RepID=A0ABU5LRK4_9SPHN|nr:2Fe-2S iron-sulfur cluster-binding protein [Sphingomonas sanguinis]MDZ7282532.1 2Fe-2S iron-sulfur cluster-binding protein [Sphingomonas sanguinis]QXT36669.1 2Fe-2S iron-sulfur cluster binding domain-containing protein [Sphingomonas sanguinis]